MTSTAIPARRPSALSDFASSVGTILTKELRGRFRGRRAFVVLTIYLGVLALIAYGAYTVQAPSARENAAGGFGGIAPEGIGIGMANASASIGQAIFSMLSVFQLLLVAFIAPAFTASAISLEREKQTLDLLITTPMRPGAIVVGKLLAALAFVFLMILAAIPVSALVLMYGGATIDDIVRQQLILFATAIGFGVIGVFFSALVRRTQVATVLTYSTMLALVIGTLLVWRFWTEVATNSPDNRFGQIERAPEQVLWLNPAVAMIEVVANTELEYGDFTNIMQSIRGDDAVIPVPVPGSLEGGSDGRLPAPRNVVIDDALRLELEQRTILEEGRRQIAIDLATGQPVVETATSALISTHFLGRFLASFGILSVLLTLAAMRLVVPAGMRFVFARRRRVTGEGSPVLEELDA